MSNFEIDRRTFNQLTAAALGGIAAGSLVGCGGEKPAAKPGVTNGPEGTKAVAAAADVHLCRGLNDCKGKGNGGDNACRGQGACATAKEHMCGGLNECKGLGGCGETVGENACKEQGGCHVPLMPGAWKKLHDKLEVSWKEKKLEYGKAPEKKKE